MCWQIYWLSVNLPAHLEDTVRKSAGKNGQMGISASRFTDCHLICQQILRRQSENLNAKIGGVFLLTDLWLSVILPAHLEETVMNSASHNGGGAFLLVDLLDCQLICQQIWRRQSGNLLAEMGDGYFCQQIYWLSVNLPANLEETGNLQANIGLFLLADLLTVS